MNLVYTVLLERDPAGGYHAFCPAMKSCHGDGQSEEEAMANIREAMLLHLKDIATRDEPFPKEDLKIAQVPLEL